MKSNLFVLLLICFSGTAFGQKTNCFKKHVIGKFTYQDRQHESEIIRTRTKQTEIFNFGKSKLILKIKWLNDSTYVLTHQKAINAPGCLDKGDWIKATITNCDETHYTATYTSNKCGNGKSTFIKLQ
jgi:hypothetical protein